MPSSIVSFLLLASAALALATRGSGAQQVAAQIPYASACSTCRVTIQKVVDLGSSNDSVLLGPGPVVRDSRGRYYARGFNSEAIVVFDSAGRYIRALGRRGQGPGEFGSMITSLQIRADSLLVFSSNGGVAVFRPDLTLARGYSLQLRSAYPPAAVGADGLVVVTASIGTAKSAGMPFHLAADTGVVSSFGSDDATVVPARVGRAGSLYQRPRPFLISPAGDRLWEVDHTRYLLTEWDFAGRKRSFVQLTGVPWLVAATAPSVADQRAYQQATILAVQSGRPQPPSPFPPYPGIRVVRVDDAGRIWTVSSVPFRGTGTGARGFTCQGSESARHPGWQFCTILDVIDPGTNRLLSSQPLAMGAVSFMGNSNYMYHTTEAPDGTWRTGVWVVTLVLR